LTLLATSLVTLGLVAGSALLLAALQRSLLGAVDEAARQGARDVAGLVDSRQLPEPVPVAGGIVVQVIDRDGRVVASSPGGDRLVPLLEGADLAAVRAGGARELAASRIGLTGTLRVVAEPAGGENEPQTVLVATPLTATARSLHVVEVALAIGSAPAGACLRRGVLARRRLGLAPGG
jgi:hypothetical protein